MVRLILIVVYVGLIVFLVWVNSIFVLREKKQRDSAKKNYEIMEILKQWHINRIKGIKIEDYFIKKGYKSVAIYGLGHLGEVLLRELDTSSIYVKYAIDRKAKGMFASICVVDPSADFEDVDAFVITPLNNVEDIISLISKKTDKPIITIEDIIFFE